MLLVIHCNLETVALVVEVKVKVILSTYELNEAVRAILLEAEDCAVVKIEVTCLVSASAVIRKVSDVVFVVRKALNLKIDVFVASVKSNEVSILFILFSRSKTVVKVAEIVSSQSKFTVVINGERISLEAFRVVSRNKGSSVVSICEGFIV